MAVVVETVAAAAETAVMEVVKIKLWEKRLKHSLNFSFLKLQSSDLLIYKADPQYMADYISHLQTISWVAVAIRLKLE
jgi:hypothetical protein